MACSSLNLLSAESPRISFSNGFADSPQHEAGIGLINQKMQGGVDTAATADNFEFSVANYTVNSVADELFVDGKLLPSTIRKECSNTGMNMIFSPTFHTMKITTTLRDELLMDDHDVPSEEDRNLRMRLPRAPKGSSSSGCKWKGRFSSFKIKSTLL